MAQTSVKIEINEALLGKIDEQLYRLARPHTGPLHKGLRKALEITKRRNYDLLPKPGYPGDKRGRSALRNAIIIKTQEYQSGNRATVLGMVGYSWYGGQHGHNVEEGHRIATKRSGKLTRSKPKPSTFDRDSKLFTNAEWETLASYMHGGTTANRRHHRGSTVEGRHDLLIALNATKSQHDALILQGIRESIDETLRENPTEGA